MRSHPRLLVEDLGDLLRGALGRSQAGEGSKQLHDREQAAHEPLHATSGPDLEQEACLIDACVAHDVHLATMNVRDLSDAEAVVFAPHSDGQRPGEDFDPFVLTSVEVTRDPTTRIEPHFELEQLARGLAGRL